MRIEQSRNLAATLAVVKHRPWPMPDSPWRLAMTWRDVLAAHWPVPAELLRQVLPAALPLDTYQGQAWVSIFAFEVQALRPRWLPPMPGVSTFPEVNVRTYVTLDGKPGVYFFSLDARSWVSVQLARAVFAAWYFKAHMTLTRRPDQSLSISSRRNRPADAPAAIFKASYLPLGLPATVEPGTLDHWLMERYCFYSIDHRGHVLRTEIHHRPWPVQPVQVTIQRNTLTEELRMILPPAPVAAHAAGRLDVLGWWPKVVGKVAREAGPGWELVVGRKRKTKPGT